jgi:CHAT domain-containing protein
MGRYTFIHFSTHGILEPGFQAIALSQIPGDKDDGFLTLGEIMNSRFNARLVVLSACETGLGEMSYSEGVTGLTRAVMYAGSAAAVVSLWSVADEGTRDLMIRFYEGMVKKGMSKAEALRAAKIDLLKDTEKNAFSHPFFWSAFVMYGE